MDNDYIVISDDEQEEGMPLVMATHSHTTPENESSQVAARSRRRSPIIDSCNTGHAKVPASNCDQRMSEQSVSISTVHIDLTSSPTDGASIPASSSPFEREGVIESVQRSPSDASSNGGVLDETESTQGAAAQRGTTDFSLDDSYGGVALSSQPTITNTDGNDSASHQPTVDDQTSDQVFPLNTELSNVPGQANNALFTAFTTAVTGETAASASLSSPSETIVTENANVLSQVIQVLNKTESTRSTAAQRGTTDFSLDDSYGGVALSSSSAQATITNTRGNDSASHQPTVDDQASDQIFLLNSSNTELSNVPGQANNAPSTPLTTAVTRESSASAVLCSPSESIVTVNANVLSQVIRLAAFSCTTLMQDGESVSLPESDIYRLLTSFNVPPAIESNPLQSQLEDVNQTEQTQRNFNNSIIDNDVIMSPGVMEDIEAEPHLGSSTSQIPQTSESDVVIIEEGEMESPRLRPNQNFQHITSERGDSNQSYSLPMAIESSRPDHACLLDCTLTESMNSSFNDESETPVSHTPVRKQIVGKRTNEIAETTGERPKKMAKLTLAENREERARRLTFGDLQPRQDTNSTIDREDTLHSTWVPSMASSSVQRSVSDSLNPASISAESASFSHSLDCGPSNFISLITEESPNVNLLHANYDFKKSSSIEEGSYLQSQDARASGQELSADSSVSTGLSASDSSSASKDSCNMGKKSRRKRCGKCENCLIPKCNSCCYCLDKQSYRRGCKLRRSKPCLSWNEGEQSSSDVPPPSHPPSLKQLRILPGSNPSQTSTESEDESDEEFHTRLDKALQEGYVEIFTAKCGVSGPPGTGKSHFRALISGKDRPHCRQSTALATEADQIIPAACITHDFDEEIVEFHRNQSDSRVKWLVVGSKKLSKLIAKTIHNQTRNVTASSRTVPDSNQDCEPSFVVPRRQISAIRKEIKKNLKALSKFKRKPKCLHKMKLLYIVDTGGQPQFQEIMPIFVRNSSMTLLVHKLNESLDDRPRFDYEINRVRYSVPDEMLVTNREYLEHSLRTICSCIFSRSISSRASRGIPKPHFAVIGTFKDQCSSRMLEEKNKAVKECIKPFTQSKKCVSLTPSRNLDNPVFAIDGSEKGWSKNDDVVDDIHTLIETVTAGLRMKIPIRWFLFLDLLKDRSRRSKVPFLSLKECYKIAKVEDIMMDEEDIDEALVLFDELNLILYFPDLLHDVVFCSPEFLYNKVSEIIAQSFDCCDASSGLTRQERMEFRTTGIFTRSLLEKVRSLNSGFDRVLFSIDDLLVLLMKLCIIAKVSDGRFFIPCVLALQRKDNSAMLGEILSCMNELGIERLLISFPDGYSPRGLFCASVAHLAKLSNWNIESPNCQLERKRNLVEFEFCDYNRNDGEVQCAVPLGKVVITDMVSHIEVYSTCDREHLSDIRRAIYGALWYASKSLSYSPTDMKVNVGFACKVDCGISEEHGTAVSFNQKTRRCSSKCIKNSSKRAKLLSDEQMSWFTSGVTSSSSGPRTTLQDLLNEVAPKTNKWESIALELDLSHTDIERIKLEEQGRIQECIQRVFSKWERQLVPAFTWPVIIFALESPSVAEFRLASELRVRYLPTLSA